jgi:hypothetical protein
VKPCCWQIAGSSGTNLAGHHMQIDSACPSSTSVSCPLCVVHVERCIVYSLYQIADQMEATVAGTHRRRRPGYEDYKSFPSRRPNRCTRCGASLPIGHPVLGKLLDATTWDIVCLDCGTVSANKRPPAPKSSPRSPAIPRGRRQRPEPTPESGNGVRLPSDAAPPVQWPVLVNYLLTCVQLEALVAPVPLRDRERWTVLPLPAETVLCGNDLTLPLLEPLQALFASLEDMEGVFYGWPTVVIENDRRQPFVAPLFVRGLDKPSLSVDANEQAFVPVGEPLPQVNMGLLTTEWFLPSLLHLRLQCLLKGSSALAGQRQ